MGFFDSIKRMAESTMKKEASKVVNEAVKNVGKGRNHSETYTFASLARNVDELQALPEASLDSAFKTTALTIVALCRYEENPDDAIEMLNFLKGPENPRPIKFRKKPSTGQWFLNDIQCLADIRVPVSEDPWA